MLKEPIAKEQFKENSKFIDVFRFYQFDSELRTLTFNAIEQLEVAIRTQFIYHLSIKNNSGFWYVEKEYFNTIPNYSSTLNKLVKNYEESNQDYLTNIKRIIATYGVNKILLLFRLPFVQLGIN